MFDFYAIKDDPERVASPGDSPMDHYQGSMIDDCRGIVEAGRKLAELREAPRMPNIFEIAADRNKQEMLAKNKKQLDAVLERMYAKHKPKGGL
jgi:hypothetical protein